MSQRVHSSQPGTTTMLSPVYKQRVTKDSLSRKLLSPVSASISNGQTARLRGSNLRQTHWRHQSERVTAYPAEEVKKTTSIDSQSTQKKAIWRIKSIVLSSIRGGAKSPASPSLGDAARLSRHVNLDKPLPSLPMHKPSVASLSSSYATLKRSLTEVADQISTLPIPQIVVPTIGGLVGEEVEHEVELDSRYQLISEQVQKECSEALDFYGSELLSLDDSEATIIFVDEHGVQVEPALAESLTRPFSTYSMQWKMPEHWRDLKSNTGDEKRISVIVERVDADSGSDEDVDSDDWMTADPATPEEMPTATLTIYPDNKFAEGVAFRKLSESSPREVWQGRRRCLRFKSSLNLMVEAVDIDDFGYFVTEGSE